MNQREIHERLRASDCMLSVQAYGEAFLAVVTDRDGNLIGQAVADDMAAAMADAMADAQEDMEPNRKWTATYKNGLPDSAFLFVRKGCVDYKDAEGRSHPLSCRELPVKNHMGRYDYNHVKNAIARAMVLKGVPQRKRRELQDKARRILEREFGGR